VRRLIVTEKNNTAKRIANILSGGKEKGRRVAGSNVYTFSNTTVMGLRGHIIDVDFPADKKNWNAVGPEELVWTDIVKKPTEKKYANALKKLGGDAEEVTIATDYDREGELIGVEALEIISSVNKEAKFDRARYSAITNDEIEKSFSNLVDIDFDLAQSADARRVIDLVWGASLTRFLSLSSMRLGNNFLSVGRVQTPTLALITEKEEEIDNFVPEPYWELYLKCVRIKDSHTRKSEISECLKDDFTFIAKHKKVDSMPRKKSIV
jgi:Topoisomerase IA